MASKLLAAITIIGLSLSTAAFSQDKMEGMKMMHADHTAEMTDGEIRKVDTGTQKVTIKHGEIKNLGMPGMTMVFQVKDPSILNRLKAGDKVKFTAEQVGSAFVVTGIVPSD